MAGGKKYLPGIRLKSSASIVQQILVACHPDRFETHWQKTVITNEVARVLGSPAVHETADIISGGTHAVDVLNCSGFHSTKKEAYDMVWLPDCGGIWFEMFEMYNAEPGDAELESVLKEEAILRMERIILCQMYMLKPGGSLYLGKILMESDLFAALILSMHDKKFIDKADPKGFEQKKVFTLQRKRSRICCIEEKNNIISLQNEYL